MAVVAVVIYANDGCQFDTSSQDLTSSGSCDPNYSGCLNPGASDYDCLGGEGNGPQYTGYVTVKGSDIHDLDSDGDGSGCD